MSGNNKGSAKADSLTAEEEAEKERKLSKAVELDNYENFDVHTWSDYPEVNKAVDYLYEELNKLPEFSGNEKIGKKHVKVIVLSLYVIFLEDPQRWARYYRKESEYRAKTRYNKLHISKKTIRIVDALIDKGYVEQVKGHHGRESGHSSHMSRMRALPTLVDLLVNTYDVQPHMVELAPDTECLILREYDDKAAKQVDVSYEDTTDTTRMRREIIAYNNLLRRNSIDIITYPHSGVIVGKRKKGKHRKRIRLNRRQKFIRRVFNNGTFEDGGRFHGGWWQRIPKEWRTEIRINGLPTVELDYSGLHIILLYHMEKIDYWKEVGTDPYKLPGIEESERMRKLLKQVLLSAINAKDKETTEKGVRYAIFKDLEELGWAFEEDVDRGDLIDRFAVTHSRISKYLFSGHGIKLQNIDGGIAQQIIDHFTKKEIPILCIHDSFIIQANREAELMDVMFEAFERGVRKVRGVGEITASKMKLANNVRTQSEFAEKETIEDLRGKHRYRKQELEYGRRMKQHVERKIRIDWEDRYYREKKIS